MRLLLLLVACADPVCHYSDGRHCGFDAVGGCPAADGCNWCDCPNGGSLACTLVACTGTPINCSSTANCPSGTVCAFQPGCNGQPGLCTSATTCNSAHGGRFCGCDGSSFSGVGACADHPHTGC